MDEKRDYNNLEYEPGFLLNMQIIMDQLEDHFKILGFYPKETSGRLQGTRIYHKSIIPKLKNIYVVLAEKVTEKMRIYENICFIVIGSVDIGLFAESSPLIVISDEAELLDVFEMTMQIFSRYSSWDFTLQRAMNSKHPIDEMLRASIKLLKNPIFLHDIDFFIISCPMHVEGMTIWEREPKTGRYMVPLSVINDLKIDFEYLHTLRSREADMFSSNQRGYRILYMNLWNGNRYEGRICVDELQSIIKKGDAIVLEYLAKTVNLCLHNRKLFWSAFGKEIEKEFIDILDGKITDKKDVYELLRFLGWAAEDEYICMKIGTDRLDFDAPVSTFGYIESQVAASHAFLYDKSITVIVNLTVGKSSMAEVISNLAYLLREGLYKIGVSNELYHFMSIKDSYKQASIALEYGLKSENTSWCFYFKNYVLEYMINKICEREGISAEFLCAQELFKLKGYDKTHNTKFYETLETYLKLERNVVATAKELFIHRSTLFYRLEKINKMISLNLDEANTRLYLKISYFIMAHISPATGKDSKI